MSTRQPRPSLDPTDRSAAPALDSVRKLDPRRDGAQPGHVRRRARRVAHHDPVLQATSATRPRRRTSSPAASPPGSGSRCCSRTSPRRWPRAAARRRRRRCARRAPRPSPTAALADGIGRGGARAPTLAVGDEVVVAAGEIIPADGEVIEGIATVDESAITGESAPVIRESGGDRSAVTGGTRVLSDEIVVRVTRRAGRDLPRPHDRAGRGRRAGRRHRTRSRSTSCSPA